MTEAELNALQPLLQHMMSLRIKLRDIEARLTAAETQLAQRPAVEGSYAVST